MADERPVLVTVICILGFIGTPIQLFGSLLALIPGVAEALGQSIPVWYSIFSSLIAIPYLVALIFIWKMKKWGLIAYTALAVIEYVIMFAIGLGSFVMPIISAIFVGLLWSQFKKMS